MHSPILPLATRLRPKNLAEFIGQKHLLISGKPLYQAIKTGKAHSMILWGPPGSGKTTIAKMIAESSQSHFVSLSAVMVGLKEVRQEIEAAKTRLVEDKQSTILFLDEVHRFNKAQQDAFLPHIENGTIIFIGATTENPSFELNNALLSRTSIYVLKRLSEEELTILIDRALEHTECFGNQSIEISQELRKQLAKIADGDARHALNWLEILIADAPTKKGQKNIKMIDEAYFQKVISTGLRQFDKGGEYFYDQISALHKAVRGSSPDGALYWFARMIDGGTDPLYIARRVVRMASEDIGNADPKALEIALNAWDVQERLGSPEGELAIAQALVYMAVAPKSNAVYTAFNTAMKDAKEHGTLPVPFHIRNAPTRLMKNLGYGKAYRYDHDEPNAFAAGQTYFPEEMGEKIYYQPVLRGLEIKISEKLNEFRKLSKEARRKEK